ncbi:hypothetical protein IAU59_004236 [Kwoniella sp. CBS 9459]
MTFKLGTILRPLFPASASSARSEGVSSTLPLRLRTCPPKPDIQKTAALPFFRDPSHTIPVKWALYRPLLKYSRGCYPSIYREIREQWKRWKGMTSVPRTKEFLGEYHTLLEYLSTSYMSSSSSLPSTSLPITPEEGSDNRSSTHEAELRFLESRLAEKHTECDSNAAQVAEARSSKARSELPPRLTGAFHRPTLYNPPLPRLKPQPIGLSMMIQNRLRKRERRHARRKVWASLLPDMKLEVSFWKDLERDRSQPTSHSTITPISGSESDTGVRPKREESDWTKAKDARCPGGWDGPIQEELGQMDARFRKENSRAESVYSEELMERVAQAKAKKKERRRSQKVSEEDKKRKKEEAVATPASAST